MKVQTFIGKSNIEGLHQMDVHVSEWMRRNKIQPLIINQFSGAERHHGQNEEPIVITSIWYDENAKKPE